MRALTTCWLLIVSPRIAWPCKRWLKFKEFMSRVHSVRESLGVKNIGVFRGPKNRTSSFLQNPRYLPSACYILLCGFVAKILEAGRGRREEEILWCCGSGVDF